MDGSWQDPAQVDPFGTADLRERVLASWASSPARFREDANAEEELVLGGYRDRALVELAQNAADAAARTDLPGRLLFRLRQDPDGPPVLEAANTGRPLDSDGVQALATLRASAKREEGTIGRFGVGFAAVLALTDRPEVLGHGRGVRFDVDASREALLADAHGAPELAAELARRRGHLPVLRLPFPAEGVAPEGYDTLVRLPLRDGPAVDAARRWLAELDDALLLGLPALAEIRVELPDQAPVVLRDVAERWHVHRRHGRWTPEQLGDRPVEERHRLDWEVTWALPRDGRDPGLSGVLYAPTATREPMSWPGILVGAFPVESSRGQVAPGTVTSVLVAEAARGWADLVAERVRDGEDLWRYVPVGLPAGEFDARLREASVRALAATPLLRAAATGELLCPSDAAAVAPPAGTMTDVVCALAPARTGLVAAPASAAAALAALGVPRLPVADLVDGLPSAGSPEEWRARYAALAPLADSPDGREDLAGLPVPLADGRVVRGARGAVLAVGDTQARALAHLGVRVVDPRAGHDLLRRLGVQEVDARGALDLEQVRAAVAEAARDGDVSARYDLDDEPFDPAARFRETSTDQGADGVPEPVAQVGPADQDGLTPTVRAVLQLVEAAVDAGTLRPGDLPWLAEVPLPDAAGEPVPAGGLVLPGSRAADWLDLDEVTPVAATVTQRWLEPVLAALGVLTSLSLLRREEFPLEAALAAEADPGQDPTELDGWAEWTDLVAALVRARGADPVEAVLTDVAALRDLDLVRPGYLPRMVAGIVREGPHEVHAAITEPARVVAGGSVLRVPSYTAWWLRQELTAGEGAVAGPGADGPVATLLPSCGDELAGLPPSLRSALGVFDDLAELDAQAVPAVLRRLADPSVQLDATDAVALWRRLSDLPIVDAAGSLPDGVRVLDGLGTRVVAAEDAVVVDSPPLLQLHGLGEPVLAPAGRGAALAELLDVALAADEVDGEVVEDGPDAGQIVELPSSVAGLLPLLVPHPVRRWCEHDRLLVDGEDVDWWVDGTGPSAVVHAATTDGLARGLAWAGGNWSCRAVLAAALSESDALAGLLAEAAIQEL